jgi:hypothetical protein
MGWLIACIVGGALILVSLFYIVRNHLRCRRALVVSGKVATMVREVSNSAEGEMTTYRPLVRFTALDGTEHEFLANISSSPPMFNTGDRVVVGYEAHTYDAEILTLQEQFGVYLFLFWTGVVVGGFCLSTLFGRKLFTSFYF